MILKSIVRHRNLFFVSIVGLSLIMGSCATRNAALQKKGGQLERTADGVAVRSTLSAEDSLRYDYFFLESVRQENAGHYAAAYDLLQHALKINPDAAEAYFAESVYLSELKQDSLALNHLEKAAALNPDNSYYIERVAQYYTNAKDYVKAIDSFEELYARNKDREDVLEILLRLYQQQKDYDKMLSTINRIEQIEGESEEIILSKMQVYELKGDKKSAFGVLKKLSDAHPSDLNYKVMMGNWLMQNKREKDAYRIFSAALKEEPDNAYVQSSMADYYQAMGQDSLANQMKEQMLLSPKTSSESRITLLQQAVRDNQQEGWDSTKILRLFQRVMAAHPKDADVAGLNAAYMSLKKMPQDSVLKAYQHVIDIAPDNAAARFQLIQAQWAKKNWDKVIDLSKPALEYNPEEMAFYYFLGVAYYQKNETDMALNTFQKGVSEINSQSDPNIVSDFYGFMGDILHQKGKADEAFAAYDSCLQWKADNVECLNNYAYFLSQENRELQKAEQMSYKTVQAEPRNSTFLDTYAWILFMQGRYAEAKIYADQAVLNDTDSVQSGVVLEHAGDIHAKLGDMTAALDYWKKALKAGGVDNQAILERKIKLKKYIK